MDWIFVKMMDVWLSIIALAATYFAILIVPGPNFLMTVRYALAYSRRVGTLVALGAAGGTAVHITAGFVGLTTILWRTDWLFDLVKIVGAMYLIFSGWKSFTFELKRPDLHHDQGVSFLNNSSALRTGFYTCLSNPKALLFYLSLFTAVIPPTTPTWAQIVMVGMMTVMSAVWYSSIAFLFSLPKVQQVYWRLSKWINYLVGGLFVVLGIRVLLS